MAEPAIDRMHPGGVYLLNARPVDANGVPLDGALAAPPAPSLGEVPGVTDDAKALAAAAEAARIAAWEAEVAAAEAALYADDIAAALAVTVGELDDFLEEYTDVAAIQAMAAGDTRSTAAAHYQARLDALASA